MSTTLAILTTVEGSRPIHFVKPIAALEWLLVATDVLLSISQECITHVRLYLRTRILWANPSTEYPHSPIQSYTNSPHYTYYTNYSLQHTLHPSTHTTPLLTTHNSFPHYTHYSSLSTHTTYTPYSSLSYSSCCDSQFTMRISVVVHEEELGTNRPLKRHTWGRRTSVQ